LIAALLLSLATSPASIARTAPERTAQGTVVKLNDAVVVDQSGRSLRFLTDVIGDRVAVVDFVYASCTTTCPLLSATMARLQAKLAKDLGSKVVLISLTLDPANDTPARLAAYADRFHRREGWYWLTGRRTEVESLLRGFGAYVANPEAHQNIFVIGRASQDRWSRCVDCLNEKDLLAAIERYR
jgi:protein SCO1/2